MRQEKNQDEGITGSEEDVTVKNLGKCYTDWERYLCELYYNRTHLNDVVILQDKKNYEM